MTWLVTGGGGYIGSHVVRALLAAGRPVVVLDDFSTGRRAVIPDDVATVAASITDFAAVTAVLRDYEITGVAHLAGRKSAVDSVTHPLEYYEQNTGGTRTLLAAMHATGVEHLVFSSSAAVYGSQTGDGSVGEHAPPRPINPYGRSKLACEWIVADAAAEFDRLNSTVLRYFNVAGAGGPGLGDRNATGLVPNVLQAISSGRPPVVFGADYPTPDGSCVRDFVHVLDVANAHVSAAERLECGQPGTSVYNVGTGRGYSVFEILVAARAVTGERFRHLVGDRRPGDPPRVIADIARIGDELGWRARLGLAEMLGSEWEARCGVRGGLTGA
ncbi:UDP-glucose 4-epimerase GalE [Nocardia aobensis]|uniref:UDP-glucose 4-epimerase GalE n=1 Tax=Nocardia aobensis TaxID=257277 RepID=UPI0002FF8FD2|nr:UDP-glucose 4-epimerase GalE [Nocardia aobensis]